MPKIKTKYITPSEYAALVHCTLSNVTEKIRNGWHLQHVIAVNKHGRFYLLEVPQKLNKQSFK